LHIVSIDSVMRKGMWKHRVVSDINDLDCRNYKYRLEAFKKSIGKEGTSHE